jgi:hypothetical protein
MMRVAFPLASAVILFAGSLAEAQEEHRRATGWAPPNPEQQEWIRQNAIVTRKVHPNKIALERINADRRSKGLPEFTEVQAGVMQIGREAEGVTGAAEEAAGGMGARSKPAAASFMSAPDVLPSYVDNSTLKYFPPIGDQGSLGSCSSWSGVYYAFTHMTAMARDWDAKNGGDAYRMSPKWTYVMSAYDPAAAFSMVSQAGCATWAEFPYDGDGLRWCLDPAVWSNALTRRADTTGIIPFSDIDTGLPLVKQLLANGYVIPFTTPSIFGWQTMAIGNDLATSADDAFAGQSCCYEVDSSTEYGAHGMTIVGYNDDIWVDINGNGKVDPGEKGALRIANSWGTGWGQNGFLWFSYDALRQTSAVAGAHSSSGRLVGIANPCWVTARSTAYAPRLVAEVTLNQLERYQMSLDRYSSGTSTTEPTNVVATWMPAGGSVYAFDGSTTACDGTFILDYTDLMLAGPPQATRYYLRVRDSVAGNPTIVKNFKLKDLVNHTEISYSPVPLSVDNQTAMLYLDYTVGQPANSPPVVYGDANGDGGFALADVNRMVDWLLRRATPPAPGTGTFTACDVNGDNSLSLADLNLLVDKLLGRITKFPVEP